MRKYIKNITTALICFLVVLLLNFALPRMLPGDPVAYLSGYDEASMSSEKYEYYYEALHIGDSIIKQFGYYIESILDGTLGYSYQREAVVSKVIKERLSVTMTISFTSVAVSSLIGLFWGLVSGQKKGSVPDRISQAVSIIVNSFPVFVIGLLLIFEFGIKLKAFKYIGNDAMIPAIITLVLAELPARYFLVRNQAAEIKESKMVLYAKERGLSNRTVRWKYIFTNMTGPFIQMIGLSLGTSVGGSVVIENIFSINGMGMLLTKAVHSLDYPLLQGILFVCAGIMTIAIILCDIFAVLFDPSLRKGDKL